MEGTLLTTGDRRVPAQDTQPVENMLRGVKTVRQNRDISSLSTTFHSKLHVGDECLYARSFYLL